MGALVRGAIMEDQYHNPVKVEYKFVQDKPWHPLVVQALIFRPGVRDNGTCYPELIEVFEDFEMNRVELELYVNELFPNQVQELDLTPDQHPLF